MNKFAEILKEYRGDKSQVKMASLLDISATYYSELERGIKLPSYEILMRIIEQSGKDANYWFGIETTNKVPTDNGVDTKEFIKLCGLLHDMGKINQRFDRYLTNVINEHTTVAQLIVIIAQIRAYLSELDPAMLPESDRRTISDLLAACQRAMDSNEHPGPREGKNLKVIND